MAIMGLDGKPLVGADGTALKARALTREVEIPTVSGVRQLFGETIAAGLLPGRLAATLRQAQEGDMRDFLTLAEEMEERELQYASVLGTRKRAITGIDPVLKGRVKRQEEDEIAAAIREDILDRPGFSDLVDDLLDALGKGYAASEIIWETGSDRWRPARFKRHDPRLFQFDRATLSSLRLRTDADPDGQTLDPMKWIIHTPRLKSGIPPRNGLARLAAWTFMMKSFTLKDWVTFLEVYGMPLRLGKYGPGASNEDKAVLLRAVRDLGSDAAAIIPNAMTIEFIESKGFSEKPFEGMADYLDKQLSKAVIGQTMTADAGGSKAQAEIHDLVRTDIKKADADQLAATINAMLVEPYVTVNFGPKAHGLWRVALPVRVPRDITALSAALGTLVPLGLKVRQEEVRETLGLTDPQEDDEVLVAPAKAAPAAPVRQPLDAAPNRRLDPRACPGCGTTQKAFNAEEVDDRDEIDELVDELLADWQPDLAPIVAKVREAAANAGSYAAFEEALNRLAPELPIDRLARRLAIGQLVARAGTAPGNAE
jgi:phage gp29-like protein